MKLFNSLSEAAAGDGILATVDVEMKPIEESIDKELVREREGKGGRGEEREGEVERREKGGGEEGGGKEYCRFFYNL